MQSWKRIAWIASAFAAPVVLAQTPGISSPPSGSAAFVQHALQEQIAEIELSKIAQNNSTSPLVIKFAHATLRDATQADRALQELAARKGIPVPDAPDAEHAAMLKVLGNQNGAELDAYYAKDVARTDDKIIQLYQSESAAKDRDAASYAQSALPQEEEHDKLAQNLADSAARET